MVSLGQIVEWQEMRVRLQAALASAPTGADTAEIKRRLGVLENRLKNYPTKKDETK
jgi:hypothetical protein